MLKLIIVYFLYLVYKDVYSKVYFYKANNFSNTK